MKTVLFFHSLWTNPWLSSAMVSIARYGLLMSGAAFAAGMIRRRAYRMLPGLMLGGLAATSLDLISGHFIAHARPFVVLQLQPLFAHPSDNSFPSDHSAVAAFLAATLWFVDIPSAIVATVVAIAIGIARVYCLVHWPADIVGGWLIGAVPAILVCAWLNRFKLR